MTGLVRKATLLGVCGLFCAVSAFANVPDPTKSTVTGSGSPQLGVPAVAQGYLMIVGTTGAGSNEDPYGLTTVTVRDAFNNPISGATVIVDFSGCCDLNLCSTNGSQPGVTQDCVARRITGLTAPNGQFSFTSIGAAKDPGGAFVYGGCAAGGVHIFANSGTGNVDLRPSGYTGVTLDLNGAVPGAPASANGTTGGDVSVLQTLVGQSFGNPGNGLYRGRGDMNMDGSVTGGDVSVLQTHVGRVFGIGGSGCTPGNYSSCGKPACP